MPALTNTRQERFCVLLSQGVPAPQAYEKVGYKPNSGNAINLMKRPRSHSDLQSCGRRWPKLNTSPTNMLLRLWALPKKV